MRILLVDPRGDTRPYDDALAGALAARGHAVELVTCRPRVATPPAPPGVRARHAFYRLADRVPGRARRVARGLEHPLDLALLAPGLVRRRPDAVHVQWLPLGAVDRGFWRAASRLVGFPVVYTAHDALPNQPSPRRLRRAARNARAFGRVVVHSEHGRRALVEELGADPAAVHVIPHGALTAYRDVAARPPAVPDGPLVALLGLLRPYKGLDVLLDAWPAVRARVPEAQLLVAGRVLGDAAGAARLAACAADPAAGVTADLRFTPTEEFAGALARADVVVLPYRRIDQSGVLFAALALGRPVVATRVGGFAEVVEQTGAGVCVEPGDPAALADALVAVLTDGDRRAAMAAASRAAADGPFAWDHIAAQTEALYGP